MILAAKSRRWGTGDCGDYLARPNLSEAIFNNRHDLEVEDQA